MTLKITIDYKKASGDVPKYLASELPPDDLINVVDAILNLGGPWPVRQEFDFSGDGAREEKAFLINELEVILHRGSSFLRLNDQKDGLTRRVDATVTAAFGSAVSASGARRNVGSASSQIRDAWKELYGVKPDPPAAYSLAIKAVESAAHATIEPNNAKATLGTMIGVMKAAPHKFRLAVPGPSGGGGVDILSKMLELLWTGQTSRHGAQTAVRAETQEQAEMAVHLAVTLVHWFSTGAVARNP